MPRLIWAPVTTKDLIWRPGRTMTSLVLSAIWEELVQSLGEMGFIRTKFRGVGSEARTLSVRGGVRRNTAAWLCNCHRPSLGVGSQNVDGFHAASAGGAGALHWCQALYSTAYDWAFPSEDQCLQLVGAGAMSGWRLLCTTLNLRVLPWSCCWTLKDQSMGTESKHLSPGRPSICAGIWLDDIGQAVYFSESLSYYPLMELALGCGASEFL